VAVTAGALGAKGGELTGAGALAVGVEPVGAETLAGGVVLLTVVAVVRPLVPDRVCACRVATAGASLLPADIGSEDRPMC